MAKQIQTAVVRTAGATPIAVALLLTALVSLPAAAQYSMATLGVAVTEDYASFTGAGFVPSPGAGQLDSDAYRLSGLSDGSCNFGETCDTGDYARGSSTGPASTGGMYAFSVDAGLPPTIGLGVQPGGSDFTPGTITIKFQNDTGDPITDFDISYDLYVSNDADRSNRWTTYWSIDDAAYTQVVSLDYTSIEVADVNGFTKVADQDESISLGAALAPGGTLYILFESDDVSGSGSRDEFAVANLSITPFGGTPVELASFSARGDGSDALLQWSTASESDFSGFEIEQRTTAGFVSHGFVSARGSGSDYSFRVTDLRAGTHAFRLKSVDLDGTFEYTAPVQVEIALPQAFDVAGIFPNPFTNEARIEFAAQQQQRVQVDVYDIVGRHVERVFDEVVPANAPQSAVLRAGSLPTGVYLVAVRGEHFVTTERATIVR